MSCGTVSSAVANMVILPSTPGRTGKLFGYFPQIKKNTSIGAIVCKKRCNSGSWMGILFGQRFLRWAGWRGSGSAGGFEGFVACRPRGADERRVYRVGHAVEHHDALAGTEG